MQVNSSADTAKVASGGKVLNSVKFGISNNTDFLHILSNIYSKPQEATAREILCNAWDAHIEAGKTDIPIKVTITDKQLIIRDYGNGIPADMMEAVYAVYGNSTKKDCVLSTGGFGLGCKAPFTYADSFTVKSFNNGYMRVYSLVKGDINHNGETTMNEIVCVPSSETGLEVTVPLKEGDQTYFTNLVHMLTVGGNILASINDAEPVELYPIEDGGYYVLEPKGKGYIHAIPDVAILYGNMLYPLQTDSDYVGEDSDLDPHEIHRELRFLARYYASKIIIKAEANTLNIIPSRENLNYTPFTIEQLNMLLDSVWDMVVTLQKKCVQGVINAWNNTEELLPVLMRNVRAVDLYKQDTSTILNREVLIHNSDVKVPELPLTVHLFTARGIYRPDWFNNEIGTLIQRTLAHFTEEFIASFRPENKKLIRLIRGLMGTYSQRVRFGGKGLDDRISTEIVKLFMSTFRGIPLENIYIRAGSNSRHVNIMQYIQRKGDFKSYYTHKEVPITMLRVLLWLSNVEFFRTVTGASKHTLSRIAIIVKTSEELDKYSKYLEESGIPNITTKTWIAPKPIQREKRKTSPKRLKKSPVAMDKLICWDTKYRNRGYVFKHSNWADTLTEDHIIEPEEMKYYFLPNDIVNGITTYAEWITPFHSDTNYNFIPPALMRKCAFALTDEAEQKLIEAGVPHISVYAKQLLEQKMQSGRIQYVARMQAKRFFNRDTNTTIMFLLRSNYMGATPSRDMYYPAMSERNMRKMLSDYGSISNWLTRGYNKQGLQSLGAVESVESLLSDAERYADAYGGVNPKIEWIKLGLMVEQWRFGLVPELHKLQEIYSPKFTDFMGALNYIPNYRNSRDFFKSRTKSLFEIADSVQKLCKEDERLRIKKEKQMLKKRKKREKLAAQQAKKDAAAASTTETDKQDIV